MISQLVVLVSFIIAGCAFEDEYLFKGCYKDNTERAISGSYVELTEDTVERCFAIARERGYDIFAVENYTRCFTSRTAYLTYWKYGPSTACVHGRGGYFALSVYEVRPFGSFLLKKIHMMNQEMKKKQMEIDSLTNDVRILTKDLVHEEERIDLLTKEVKGNHRLTQINVAKADAERRKLFTIQHNVSKNSQSIADIIKAATGGIGPLFFPKGTKDYTAYRIYPAFHATFVGFGHETHCPDWEIFQGTTLIECIRECYSRRTRDGSINKVMFIISSKQCQCHKGSTGFAPSDNFLHYDFK